VNEPPGGRWPTFLVIGVAKAGTTSLYRYLGQHPEIFMSPVKEPRFFALEGDPLAFTGPGDDAVHRETTTTLAAYRRLFEGVRDERAIGEASVLYLHHSRAPQAIARAIPAVKLVAILRHPADRAFSAYLYRKRDGYEPLDTFEAVLDDEPRRIAAGWYQGWHHREQGFYYRGLARYFERFDARQIRVYLYDDFDQRPVELLADLFDFLGVDPLFRPDVSIRYNPSGLGRSPGLQRLLGRRHPMKDAFKALVPERWAHGVIARLQHATLERPAMRPETRARLIEGYHDDIRQLEKLIRRDLSHWLV
jgi:hypothetical protein